MGPACGAALSMAGKFSLPAVHDLSNSHLLPQVVSYFIFQYVSSIVYFYFKIGIKRYVSPKTRSLKIDFFVCLYSNVLCRSPQIP